MNNAQILFRFIDDNLEFGDLKRIAVDRNLSPTNGAKTVSAAKRALKKGIIKSKPLVKALEEMALLKYNGSQQIKAINDRKTKTK